MKKCFLKNITIICIFSFVVGLALLKKPSFAKTVSKIETYKLFLSKLDKKDPNSILKSIKEYQRLYGNKTDFKSQDQSMEDWWSFDSLALDSLNKTLDKIENLSGRLDSDLFKALERGEIRKQDAKLEKAVGRKSADYLEKLYANGMAIFFTEDMAYADYNPKFIDATFSPYLSPLESGYLHIRMDEFDQGFSNDAILLIPWDDVRKRIVRWDMYLKKFPTSKHKAEIQGEMEEYLEVYLSGTDNTHPCVDNNEGNEGYGHLLPELKKSYENLLSQNRDCQYLDVIRDYYKLLKENDFDCGKVDVKSFLTKHGLKTMNGIQPMLR